MRTAQDGRQDEMTDETSVDEHFLDRATGSLYGPAIGDALGAPCEGWSAERIGAEHRWVDRYVTEDVAGTDDTEFAVLCARAICQACGWPTSRGSSSTLHRGFGPTRCLARQASRTGTVTEGRGALRRLRDWGTARTWYDSAPGQDKAGRRRRNFRGRPSPLGGGLSAGVVCRTQCPLGRRDG
jgi:hypothetical protein